MGTASETAAHHLVRQVPTARMGERVGAVLDRLPGERFDITEMVCVVDGNGLLKGIIRLPDLLAASAELRVEAVMIGEPPAVLPEEDQEAVAEKALKNGLTAIPVIDLQGVFLGLVPPLTLMRILRREHVQDLERFTGILDGTNAAREALEDHPLRRVRHRLPWLLVGLFGSSLATFIVARFEQVLTDRVAVAFFIPGLVYLADAIGTQTEAIAVRGLSFSPHSLRQLLCWELLTGALIGSLLGLLAFPAIVVFFGDIRLAIAVLMALLAAGCSAAGVGLFFPWLLSRMGLDPAFGSGPLATIFQDILSLLVYFLIVVALLPPA